MDLVTDENSDDHGRPMPPQDAGEIATLLGFLDYQRATLEWKCRGLSDDQLRVALPPTSMTLGALLKHLAYVEDYWFTEVISGEPAPEPWASADTEAEPDWEWHSAVDDTGDDLRALWAERVARSRTVVRRASETPVEAVVRTRRREANVMTMTARGLNRATLKRFTYRNPVGAPLGSLSRAKGRQPKRARRSKAIR
jgi:hypothetical protein